MTLRSNDALSARNSVFLLGRSFQRLNDIRLQLSSGRRINAFSDDPLGSGLVRRYKTLQDANRQYLRNLGTARSFLESADTSLQSMNTRVSDLREVLLREVSGIATDQSNLRSATEVRQLREELLSAANQQVQGRRIFGGFQTRIDPFVLVGERVEYRGDDNEQLVQLGPNSRVAISIPGSDLLGTDTASLAASADLQPRVGGATPLSSLNGGAGVNLGSIAVTVGAGPAVNVDLSAAVDVQDVLDGINAAVGGITARISDDERGITLEAAGLIAVAEAGATTASDLGLIGTDTTGLLVGTDVRGDFDETTDFGNIRTLDGKLPLGVLRIEIAGTVTDVDLSSANNVADIRAIVQGFVPDMDVQARNDTLVFTLGRPEAFLLSSPEGDGTAASLGLAGSAGPARLFDLFADAIAALEAGDRVALRQLLVEVEAVEEHLGDRMVAIGGRQNAVDQAEQVISAQDTSLARQRSRIEDVDIIAAASDLAFAETAYQAALASSARLFNLSLVQFL